MKTISLLQPWASLVVLGYKKLETRSFNTAYRGPLLIHASKGYKDAKYFCDIDSGDNHFRKFIRHWTDLSFGAIIGQVNLIDTMPTEKVIKSNGHILTSHATNDLFATTDKVISQHFVTEQELAFGDYGPGRWGWLLTDAVQFATSIPAKGQLGFWNYDMPDHVHVPNKYGGHATFQRPPTAEELAAVNTMAELAFKMINKP